MKKKLLIAVMAMTISFGLMAGCGSADQAADVSTDATSESSQEELTAVAEESASAETENEAGLEDGIYDAKFTTNGTMFHINEAYHDMGVLTVENGVMTIHITLPSKNIVNLFPGTSEDAQKEGAKLLEPTVDEVTYEDGTTEEVNGFDVPVPVIDEEFDLALVGTKGKWYDHKVMVSEVKLHEADVDKEAADKVAELIDAIYVQNWTEETEAQCQAAKEAWDALTDEQKELVEGEFADPDYFGRDTGDASKDDPLNGDDIGDKEILVVSFGTSFNDSRAQDIGGIEKAIQKANPDWSVRRAFTAQIIINHVLARDGEKIDNVDQALKRAVDNGVSTLVIQPTHLMHGAEYDELCETLKDYEDKIENVVIAEPLLGEVGADAKVINKDKETVAKAITAEAVKEAGFESLEEAVDKSTAFVFMGHGTSHTAKVTYSQMQTQMDELGYENVFIGTVEGEPEETELSEVINKVKEAGYKNVILRPLMVVAGDHANNDMAGDEEDSWKSGFEADGSFDSIECQISGLGRIEDVQKLYVEHTGSVLK